MSLVIDIADAVMAELAGGQFSQAFVPTRSVLPAFELAELKDLRVTVVPKSVEIAVASRQASTYELRMDIGVQKKLPAGADLEADVAALLGLVDELATFFRNRTLQAAPTAAWVGIANDPIYALDHLAEQRVFTSVLTLTYRVLR